MVSRLQDDEKAFLKGSLLLHQICCYTAQDTVRDVITWFVARSHSNTSSHNNSNNNTKSNSGSSSSSCSTMSSSPSTEVAAKQELLIDKHVEQDFIRKIKISVKEAVVKEEKEEEEEEIVEEPKIIKKNKTTKSQESFVNNTSQHTINNSNSNSNSNSSGSTSFSKHKKQNPKLKLNRKKENSKSKLSTKASKKSASSYFVRATKHIIVKTFGGVTSKNKSFSKSDPSTTATTMMTEHKRKFDLMDVDLAEDGDTDLEDATSRDEEEEGHVDTDLVDTSLEDAVVRDEEEEGHDYDGDDLSTSKTKTTGIQLKKNEDDDPGDISIDLTPTFDSVDVDLAEDLDTDLEDAVDDDDGDGDDPWHMTVENVITEIIKEQQVQEQDQEQEHKSVVGSEDIASFLVSCPFLTSVLLSLLIVEIENQEDVSRSTSIDDIPPPPPPPPPERHSIPYSVVLPTDNDGEAPPSPIRKTIKYWEEKSLNDSIFSSNASFFDIPLPPTTGRLSASQLCLFEDHDDCKRNIGPIDLNESYDDVHVEDLRHEMSLDNGYKNLPRMSAITHDSVTSLNTLPAALPTSKFSDERRSTRHTRRSLRRSSGSIRHSSDQRTMIIAILCITFGISFVDDIFNYCETQSIFHVHDIPSFFNNVIVDDNNKDKNTNNNNTNNTFLVNDDESSSSSQSSTLMKTKKIHQQQRQHYWDEHIVSLFL